MVFILVVVLAWQQTASWTENMACVNIIIITIHGQHSAREVTPYPWECSALPTKYFKTRSLSRRLRRELLNKTWKMMSAAQRLRRRSLVSFFECIFSRRKGIANLGEQRRSDVTEAFNMPRPVRWGPNSGRLFHLRGLVSPAARSLTVSLSRNYLIYCTLQL